jgi:pimeloyl-ACP methyl ester carboxylesterase
VSAPPKEKIFQLETGKVAALEWGPEGGKPVLALHGWLDNAASFAPLAALLPECRLIAIDLPGHGLSDHRPPGTTYHLIDGVTDALQVADKLGWKKPHWIGHSMGGAVAVLAAGAAPDRFERLVLLESLGPIVDGPDMAAVRLASHLKDRREFLSKRLPVYPDLETAVRARMTAGDLSAASARCLAERGTKPSEGGLTWRSDPRLRINSPVRLTEDQVHSFLSHIQCPTLVVAADEGLVPLRHVLKSRFAKLKQGTLESLPGGHHLHLDHPERVAPSIRKFLGLS